MRMLSFSVLTNQPIGNPNRNKDGTPKTTQFGGSERARYSSQSLNFVLRESAKNMDFSSYFGSRTTQLADLVAEQIKVQKFESLYDLIPQIKAKISNFFRVKDGENKTPMIFLHPDDPKKIAQRFLEYKKERGEDFLKWLDPTAVNQEVFKKLLTDEDVLEESEIEKFVRKTSHLLEDKVFSTLIKKEEEDEEKFSDEQKLKLLSEYISATRSNSEDKENNKRLNELLKKNVGKVAKVDTEKFDKAFWEELDLGVTLDMALFGRGPFAKDQSYGAFKEVNAAFITAHAIGINEYEKTPDFFTTYDDVTHSVGFLSGEEENNKYLHSSLMYSWYALDLDQLERNLPEVKGNKNLLSMIVEWLVRGVFGNMPKGMDHKTGTIVDSEALLVEYSNNVQLKNHANAFDKAIRLTPNESITEIAIERLATHVSDYSSEYPNIKRVWFSPRQKENPFGTSCNNGGSSLAVVKSLKEATDLCVMYVCNPL